MVKRRWLFLKDNLIMVDNCAHSVDKGPHNSIFIHVSEAINNLEQVFVIFCDESVNTVVIIDSLVNCSLFVTLISILAFSICDFSSNWVLSMEMVFSEKLM